MKKSCFVLLLTFISVFSNGQHSTFLLTESESSWEFLYYKSAADSAWLPTSYERTIFNDLNKNKIISNPYQSSNSDSIQWVNERKWKYRNYFSVPETILSKKNILIRFNGLDTYANVWLNGNKILEATNMFRIWEVAVKKLLMKENNELLIEFTPPSERAKQNSAALPIELPGQAYSLHRKAAFQFGWDWAPKMIGCGIWKSIELIYWDDFHFKDIQLHQLSLTDSLAIINAEIFYENKLTGNVELRITDTVQHKTFYTRVIELNESGKTVVQFEIKNPKRWWCNGYGEAYLYHLKFDLVYYNLDTLFSVVKNYGARAIELIQTPDSAGSSFYFKLNGVPIFIKGANYVPPDALLRENISDEKNSDLILAAKESHMNMLRVWGGGTYASDKFYDACDANGIMVWQDFPFACAMYPGDSAFINNVSEEIKENVLRIRNHPSLALWCGNNEIKEGWFNWGWQKQFHYYESDSLKIWNDYLNIFEKTIPSILKTYDTQTPYWPSSPSIGWGRKESLLQGDVHYWGVWWGMEPFSSYINHTGRFVSEFGFQSFPSMNCLQQYLKPNELYLYSPALKVHQKHPTGFETIQTYLKRDYDTTINFENYVYLSQLLQAKGMSTAIEAHRRAKPYCMGTMYWQLNDCWPAISWSSIDYAGNKKAFHYQLNRLYNTYLLSMVKNETKIECWIISDSLKNTTAQLQLSLWSFSGNLLWKRNVHCEIDEQSSKLYFQMDIDSVLKKYDSTEIVLHGELMQGETEISYSDYFFSSPKNLKLQEPEVNFKIIKNKKGLPVSFIVSNKKPALNFYISATIPNKEQELGIETSANYFNLFPNEKKEIKVNGFKSYKDFEIDKIKIHYQTLNEITQKNNQ